MTRNHFSKYGGPCFVNDGFTHHTKPESPIKPEEYIKPDIKVFYVVSMLFGILLVTIGTFLILAS